jgi:hypothetical protein
MDLNKLRRRSICLAATLVFVATQAALGQDGSAPADSLTLFVTGAFSDGWVRSDSAIVLTLSRSLIPSDGRLAILIGANDVTALFEGTGTSLRYRARSLRLPPGQSEVTVYSVRGSEWTQLASLPIRILTPSGFASSIVKPSVSLNNKGQLAEGHSGLQASPDPATYQAVGFSGGLETTHERDNWSFRTQSNYIGVSRQNEALRFGIRQDRAPKIDLSDYTIQLARGLTSLSFGHLTEGTNRHLINSFASRGVEARVGGQRASVILSAVNGSSTVGWNNITGLENRNHRIQSGTLNVELLPSRAGALHLDATLMNGSLLPQTAFTQGAVVDAEQSTGGGVQFSASTPSQRLRLSAGVSRSRFENSPNDRELVRDTAVVPVQQERRGASYLELNAALLQNASVAGLFSTTLNAVYRRERVDPMYRSVAAQAQADRLNDSYELAGNVGAIALQVAHTRYHDNLDDIPSILRTLNRMSTAQISVPVAALLRAQRGAFLLPSINYGVNRVHQFGAGIPINSEFSASHVPNQLSNLHNGTAAWQLGRWKLQYRYNQSLQDNRQTGRERADFYGVSNTIAIDVAARSNLDAGYEASTEHQTNRESAQTSRVRRAGGSITWRPTALTTLTGFASINVTRDDPLTADVSNREARLELTHGFNLGRNPVGGGTRGQLFIRYANTSGLNWAFPGGAAFSVTERAGWTVNSGVSLRLY